VLNDQSMTTTGVYVQQHWDLGEKFSVVAGVRVDRHSRFGQANTWRAAASVPLGDSGLRLKGTVGTGFKAPTLYQLFSSFGNPTLKPERSLGRDFGVEQSFARGAVVASATYFDTIVDEMIDFDSGVSAYNNIARVATRGVELEVTFALSDDAFVSVSHTTTRALDRNSHLPLIRRAPHKFAIRASLGFGEFVSFSAGLSSVGIRDDLDFSGFPATRIHLESYLLLNLALAIKTGDDTEFHIRIENALDEEYQEVLGYGVPGASAYLGFKKTF
jgi:vitamin B12 transporter